MQKQFQDTLKILHDCIDACNRCAVACLQEADVKRMERCIRLDLDCAGACRLAADYLARGSEFGSRYLQFCAEICQACGEECQKFPMDHCQECAEACFRCAEACRKATSQAQR